MKTDDEIFKEIQDLLDKREPVNGQCSKPNYLQYHIDNNDRVSYTMLIYLKNGYNIDDDTFERMTGIEIAAPEKYNNGDESPSDLSLSAYYVDMKMNNIDYGSNFHNHMREHMMTVWQISEDRFEAIARNDLADVYLSRS